MNDLFPSKERPKNFVLTLQKIKAEFGIQRFKMKLQFLGKKFLPKIYPDKWK